MNIKNIPRYIGLILGLRSDELLGFRLTTIIANYLMPSYRFTWPELAWFQDPKLKSTLILFEENHGFNAHRRFALQQLLRLTSSIPGDTAECGVYRGCGSYVILQANKYSSFNRIHHIYDSFEGLSQPSEVDGKYWAANNLSMAEDTVNRNLSQYKEFKLYKGWIPDRFHEVQNHSFSFVHIDVDLYDPTLESIKFFYDRLNSGGILVCDDYGFLTCPGATKAIDEFLFDKPEKMILLAGGGGFFIKGILTSLE